LITQTFIENAIWHGLIPLKNKRNPLLKIELLLNNNFPTIIIEDNGVGRDISNPIKETSKGTKLIMDKIENLNRLSKTTSNKIEIIDLFDDEKNQIGTKVIIQLENV
jgi:LytS/YehU family sensor histidine kinase